MKVEFDVNLEQKHIFKFNMRQAYKGAQGLLSIMIPAIILGRLYVYYGQMDICQILMHVGLGILFILYVPVSLWLGAKRTLKKNSVLSNTLHFVFSENGISVMQGEEKAEFQWENIYRMISTRELVLIYTNRINAYIIPRKQMGTQYTELKQLANTKLEKYRCKM